MMLRLQRERMNGCLRALDAANISTSSVLTRTSWRFAKPDALVMHPGPMNRGVEISSICGGWRAIADPRAGRDGRGGAHGRARCAGQPVEERVMPDMPILLAIPFGIVFWLIFLPILWPTWILAPIYFLIGFLGFEYKYSIVFVILAVIVYVFSSGLDLDRVLLKYEYRIELYYNVIILTLQYIAGIIAIGVPAGFYAWICHSAGGILRRIVRKKSVS